MIPWFWVGEDDTTDAFGELEGSARRFVRVLRERAVTWGGDPDDTFVLRPEETGFGHLVALVRVGAEVFGAFFDEQGGVYGTELHDQMYVPLHGSSAGPFRTAGSPGACAERTADWFETLRSRV
ncbi:hypothetical protein ACFY7C_28510 [Streptomyces sp. NPDC012769]|uniref:hypothetical protein n=1 Tax=Streptomyces sp. NPDC012769 TaxID=3364848 RepID=UPI003681325B